MPLASFRRSKLFNSLSRLSVGGRAGLHQSRALALLFAAAWCLCAGSPQASAQNVQYTSNLVDKTKRSSLRVDPTTLGLSVEIPIAEYPGRAGVGLPVTFNYSSKLWRMKFIGGGDENAPNTTRVAPAWGEHTAAGWTNTLGLPKLMDNPQEIYDGLGFPTSDCAANGCWVIRKVTVQMPDGSSHVLRHTSPTASVTASPSGTYHAVDGSGLRYEYDSKTLHLPDGSRYVLGSLNFPATATTFTDRNGNKLSHDPATNLWTDTLGRTLAPPPMPTSSGDYAYTIPGVGVGSMTYTFKWRALANALADTSQQLAYLGDCDGLNFVPPIPPGPALFFSSSLEKVCANPGATFNPTVLAEIVLPNGTSYKFSYNPYGEIEKVVYPMGGYERFLYDVVQPVDWVNGVYVQANRGVIDHYVSASGSASDEVRWHYVAGRLNWDYNQPYKVTITAPDGTYTERYLYAASSAAASAPWGFSDARFGRAHDERSFTATGQMVRRTLTQRVASSQDSSQGTYPNARVARVDKQVEILLDTGTGDAQTKTTTYQYDGDFNVIATNLYDFYPVSQSTGQSGLIGSIPAGTLLRTDEITYLVNDTNIDPGTRAAYRSRNLLHLPSSTRVRDASSLVRARTEVRYDEASFPVFTYGAVTGWADPQTTVRGNPTTRRRWLDTTGAWLETHSRYDQCGNVRKTWDANDLTLANPSQMDYTDSFSDGFGRNTYAYPTSVTTAAPNPAAIPNPAGGLDFDAGTFGSTTGLTSASVYDFKTGRVARTTDANGETTEYDYNDPLNRLKRIDRPDGGRTSYFYADTHPCGALIETRTLLDASGREVSSWQFFDKLGRPHLSESWDGQDAASPYLRVDTRYDSMGRVSKVSNSYRTAGCGATPNPSERWTTTAYDALGRVTTVTTPDGAAVTTAYAANSMTVTDQKVRKRSSVTDALGRMTRVVEDPTAGGLNYVTDYTYDVLGNPRTVTQGEQPARVFVYDSLSRLTSVTNPESGVTGYTYDANGNLKTKTDARGVIASYTYDRLNRNIITAYAGGGTATPQVRHHYDNPNASSNGLGRLHWTEAVGVSSTAFDAYDPMGRPAQYHQVYRVGGVWGRSFNVARTYDRAGNVLSQTYPSGHTISYNYDAAGRLGDNGAQPAFAGNLGDGLPRTYASLVTYSEFGGIREEKFGTQTPLYHKLHYNARGQLYSVRLSTHPLASNQWDWNRGAITSYYDGAYTWGGAPGSTGSGPDNNGNVRRTETFIPADEQSSSFTAFRADYEYDALNRLKWMAESRYSDWSGQTTPSFKQAFTYDRWGNRTINADETQVYGQNPGYTIPEPLFELSPQSNRLHAPGDANRAPSLKLMRYDAAGNLVHDAHTGRGDRTYDGENRMTGAVIDAQGNWSYYTYDADGRRVKRTIGNEEWWQVYGMGGELLAEYRAGAATYLPSKEYGYRDGELLVTMSSGDDQRLGRFVRNLYYGALQRDPTAQELQDRTNELATAGAQGEAQLLQKAKEIARALFVQTVYETSPARSDAQYVTDLYYAYLHRAPDTPGLNNWTAAAAGGVTNRSYVCDAFQQSAEFSTLVSTLYGSAESDGQRRDRLIHVFHLGAYGMIANSTELTLRRGQLDAAAAIGPGELKVKVELMGRELFAAQVADLSLPAQQFVTNLYESFLQRGPDAGGLAFWTGQAGTTAQSRQNVLNAFAGCDPFRELAATLYRETFWLVPDHLGTPRMMADRTGSLAGIKRHDYLPYGEELFDQMAGRTTTQGYGAADNVRQKFTGYERDAETNLDYASARYYSSAQGRFTSPDPLLSSGKSADPQSWNRYAYCGNNPVNHVDPSGLDWYHNSREDRYRWFTNGPTEDGWERLVGDRFVYHSTNGWVALDPYSANWRDGFGSEAEAKGLVDKWWSAPPQNRELAGTLGGQWGPPVKQVTEYSFIWMSMFAGPVGGAGRLTTLGLEGGGAAAARMGVFRFSQTTARHLFNEEGTFAGRTIGEVAKDLRAGIMSPSQLPVGVVNGAEGVQLIVNTRSSLALMRGGIPQRSWNIIDFSANPGVRANIEQRLIRNGLTNHGTEVLRITEKSSGLTRASSLR